MKRIFDILFSFCGLFFLLPFFLLISILIVLDSKGGVFYKQIRVGKEKKDFKLLKFRTMKPASDTKGLLTVGNRDNRITKIGYYLRKYKIDEFPQLINVLVGEMSLVGPRPEVRKYTNLYTQSQQKVLSVKPGITDYASIKYIDENRLLGESKNPEKTYIEEIMPKKLELNLKYIDEISIKTDLKIIFKTIGKIISG